MSNPQHKRKTSWYSIILNDNWCLIPSVIVLTNWVVWLVQLTTGVNLFRSEDESSSITADGMLQMAIIGTTICLPLTIYRYMRTRGVLIYGVDTPFRILSQGLLKHAGYRDIRIEYEIGGKLFTKSLSAYGNQADGNFKLIVNPKKPKHITIEDLDK